jgi:O-antigen ligase
MQVLAITLFMALAVWGVIALLRGSVLLSTAIFLVCTSCLPPEFASVDAMGVTLTLDRVWLLALIVQVGIQWYQNRLRPLRLEGCDLAIGLFFLWLVARTITQPLGSAIPGQPNTLMHLVNGYAIPIALYVFLRFSPLSPEKLKPMLVVLVLLSIYLSFTAVMEVAKIWSLVFPKFIADPSLGIHFGRARGPMLQSVRLGICLNLCLASVVVFVLWINPTRKINWLLAVGVGSALLLASFLTYTRSIWMGIGMTIVLLICTCLTGQSRRLAIGGLLAMGLIGGIIKGPNLVAFKREYSAAETRESTYMRAAFAYVSVVMIKERPLMGYGFNQFQVYNRPFLADRSTDIRLESIRGYVHHNSFLSLLVDLGLIGFSLYAVLFASLTRRAIVLWRNTTAPKWARGIGLVTLAIGITHLIQMAFHEVSFSAIENGWMFASFGLVVSAYDQFCVQQRQPPAVSAVTEGLPTKAGVGQLA